MAVVGTDTFQDAITKFRNRALMTYVGHILLVRGQLLQDGEFGVQSGWDTATNDFAKAHLVRLDELRRKITHNPEGVDIKTLEDRAKDLSVNLASEMGQSTTPLGDEVARPAGREVDLPYKLDGSDPNIPNLSEVDLRNTNARMFMSALDMHLVEATRLDCRFATYRVTTYESVMLYASLVEMFDMCDSFGGDENRVPITFGVRPSEEPQGVTVSPNREGASA